MAAKSKSVELIGQEYDPEVPIDSIIPHPKNPNRGNEAAILESVAHLGFWGAIVCQKSSRRILAGEHRWKACKKKKLKTVPVLWVECDDLHAIRIMLADNRTADLGRYSEEEKSVLLNGCVDKFGKVFLAGTGYTTSDLLSRKTAIDGLTRDSAKAGRKLDKKTTVVFAIGRVKFNVNATAFGEWLDRLEQEAEESGKAPEAVAAERLGLDIWLKS